MSRQRPRVSTIAIVVAVALVVGLAMPAYAIPWWDTFAHFVGGAAVAIVALRVAKTEWQALALLVVVGLGWEFFEVLVIPHLTVTGELDTLVDISAEIIAWALVREVYDGD